MKRSIRERISRSLKQFYYRRKLERRMRELGLKPFTDWTVLTADQLNQAFIQVAEINRKDRT